MSDDDNDGGGGGAAASDGCRIYVGNLIPKANEVHLKKLFAKFGVIHTIWVARKVRLYTARMRSTGLVE